MSTAVLSLRVEGDLKARLDRLARSTGRPASFYVREALAGHLDELEYAYTLRAEVEEYRSGRREPGDWNSMKDRLGLD
ncbi:type II toxin-antitoxin system RelB family antitoxin [Dermabacteraceae bacterium CCM 9519]